MNKFLGFLLVGMLVIAGVTAFTSTEKNPGDVIIKNSEYSIEIPADVNAVLQDYCFGCHNTKSRNEKGKGKLTIDELGDIPKGKLAAKLNKIAEEVGEGEMPPKKFLEKYPDKEPSKKDRKLVVNWAKSAVKEL